MLNPPGEVQPEKARTMNPVFAACLQQIVTGFRAQFFVTKNPEKLQLQFSNSRTVSFDILARLENRDYNGEVWIEAKAYETASDLLQHYRKFVRHVALLRVHVERVRSDQFWFVTSVPFACREGTQISTHQWMRSVVRDDSLNATVPINSQELDNIERRGYEGLARSINVLFLTRQLMKITKLKQYAGDGDHVWGLTKALYDGVPEGWGNYELEVQSINALADPNRIQQGPIILPFRDDLVTEL